MEPCKLSANDAAVLSAIVDPEGMCVAAERICPPMETSHQIDHLGVIEDRIVRSIERGGLSEADLGCKIKAFDNLIETHPNRPSTYNNRAQARRLLHDIEHLPDHPNDLAIIMSDLDTAIRLASPVQNTGAVPATYARVLAAAHTHRGYILYRSSKQTELRDVLALVEGYQSSSISGLEEAASKDFFLGGRYGNPVAKRMAIQTNPYAKMCGEMVKQAMRAETREGVVRT